MVQNSSILLVEDDQDIQTTVRLVLEFMGYEVHIAHNGLEGLEAFQKLRPQLVLLDMNMPVMDGWEFLREIRKQPEARHVPVVALSAGTNIGVPTGATAFVPKPLSFDQLTELADTYCRSQRQVA